MRKPFEGTSLDDDKAVSGVVGPGTRILHEILHEQSGAR